MAALDLEFAKSQAHMSGVAVADSAPHQGVFPLLIEHYGNRSSGAVLIKGLTNW